MKTRFTRLTIAALVVAGCSTADQAIDPTGPADDSSADVALADKEGERVYEVTVENLTTGQPFSPGVIVTHAKKVTVFRVGEAASEGIRLIAEDGDPSTAAADLSGAPGVQEVVTIDAPIHRIGGPGSSSTTFEIRARGNANRLSVATMLICTNDGFTGVDSVKLPGGFKPETHLTGAFDAGTEANDELFPSIVDPCQAIGPVPAPPDDNARTATSGVIAIHSNIQGVGDLDPELHRWRFPVARITVQRVQ